MQELDSSTGETAATAAWIQVEYVGHPPPGSGVQGASDDLTSGAAGGRWVASEAHSEQPDPG